MSEEMVRELARNLGGEIKEMSGPLSDGSGFAVISYPLPKDHWMLKDPDGFNVPPMPLRMGENDFLLYKNRRWWADALKEAGKYAVRCATLNGTDMDFDPDALLQCLVVGMIGYWTPNGLSEDEWANPKKEE